MSTLVVLGSGPGIGISTAKLFAQKNHFSKIALIARNAERLQGEKAEVESAAGGGNVEVKTYPTDLSNFDQTRATLSEVGKLGSIGCIFFNAARIQPSEVLKTPVEEIEEDFRVTNLAMYITAQWGIPLLQKTHGAFIVTNSHLPEEPLAPVLSLSAVKASQQNILHSLRQTFGEEVHIGVIKVSGQVSPEEKNLNPTKIAEAIVGFYEQDKGQWGSDVVLKP